MLYVAVVAVVFIGLVATTYAVHLITRRDRIIMADLTALQAAVTAETTVEGSVLTLLKGLAAQIAALPPNNQAAIDALTAEINANISTMQAAVTANTPAAPPATPPAAPGA